MFSNNKGITLVILVITVIVLVILTGVITYSGISALEDAKIQTFTNNINQVQAAIDTRWLKYQNNSSITLPGKDFDDIPDSLPNDPETSYYILDDIAITELGLSDLEPYRYIVNYSTGEVIDTIGIRINGTTYYTLESLEL